MSNRTENRRFEEAVRQIERRIHRQLSAAEKRLHDEISRHGYTLKEMVDVGEALFR